MAVLSNDEIDQRLRALAGWSRQGSAIVRQFAFKGFPEAVAFVSRLVPGAEAADHHPGPDDQLSQGDRLLLDAQRRRSDRKGFCGS